MTTVTNHHHFTKLSDLDFYDCTIQYYTNKEEISILGNKYLGMDETCYKDSDKSAKTLVATAKRKTNNTDIKWRLLYCNHYDRNNGSNIYQDSGWGN
jgi:hypothetical protein